ncbi:hypothetical protein MTO96_017652 [Rhipicephalus appendiculatus]
MEPALVMRGASPRYPFSPQARITNELRRATSAAAVARGRSRPGDNWRTAREAEDDALEEAPAASAREEEEDEERALNKRADDDDDAMRARARAMSVHSLLGRPQSGGRRSSFYATLRFKSKPLAAAM